MAFTWKLVSWHNKPGFIELYLIWIYFDPLHDFLTVERQENYYIKLEREKLKAA